MNKSYRLIYNEITNTWVAAAETAKGRGKRSSGAVVLAAAGLVMGAASAVAAPPNPPAPTQLPTGGQVVAGQAAIVQNAATLNVKQSTNRAAIDWATFNVGSQAQVNFNQPGASSVTLNRVLDSNPSQIFGRITAPGQVFLTNPSGMYFAPGASVDVGGLVATTHSINNADFMAGGSTFTRNGATGSIVNEGTLTANHLGGYIALLAPEVRNQGVIVAQMGTVALAAGEAYELQFDSNNALANILVTPASIAALVENGNAVQAPGGLVILSARAADQLRGSVVRNSGAIEAKGLVDKGGRIVLEGDHITLASGSTLDASGATGGGEVLVGGDRQGSGYIYQATTVTMEQGATIDASATQQGDGGKVVLWSDVNNANTQTEVHGSISARGGVNGGNGGTIETSGHWLDVAGIMANASAPKGNGGDWLLDPYNITIAASGASGTAYSTTYTSGADSIILASTVAASLSGGTSVTLTTGAGGSSGGDITIAAPIAKTGSADATLTLNAHRDIALNADITSTSNKLNLVFNADSDRNGDGAIIATANLVSNGGNINFGGSNTYTVGTYFGGSGTRTITGLGSGTLTFYGNVLLGAPLTIGGDAGTNGASVVFNGAIDSGNTYALNTTANTGWSDASSKAIAANGYLATITSALENSIVRSAANSTDVWLGAQNTGGGVWKWTTGPEAGRTFFLQTGTGTGTVQGGYYNNWTTGEPNGTVNCTTDCAGLQMWYNTGIAKWDDTGAATANKSFIVETTGTARALDIRLGTSSGTVTFQGAVGAGSALSSLNVNAASTALNGTALITTGAQAYDNALTVNSSSTFHLSGSSLAIASANQALSITATGDVTIDSPSSVAGPISIYGGNINLNANLTSTLSGAAILAKASGNITQGVSADVTTTGGSVTYWADSDANNIGRIELTGGTSGNKGITTNGGAITMGGGSDIATGYAYGYGTAFDTEFGVNINSYRTLNAGTGAITLRGATTATLDDWIIGVRVNGTGSSVSGGNLTFVGNASGAISQGSLNKGGWGTAIVNGASVTGSGTINISGTGGSGTTSGNNVGVYINTALTATGTGTVTIIGQGGSGANGTTGSNHGITLDSANAVISTNNGSVSLTGTGGGSSGTYNQGISFTSAHVSAGGTGTVNLTGTGGNTAVAGQRGVVIVSGQVDSAGGAITIIGTGGASGTGDSSGVSLGGGTAIIGSATSGAINITGTGFGAGNDFNASATTTLGNASAASDITLNANSLSFASTTLQTTGKLTLAPRTSFSSPFTWSGAGTNFVGTGSIAGLTINSLSNLSGLTLGKAGNTADMTIANAVSIAGPISIYGGNVNLNSNLAATASGAAIFVSATSNIATANTAYNTITTNNGNISVIGDANADGSGVLGLGYKTLSAGTGNVLVRGELTGWNASGYPTISSTTGTFTFESSDASFGQGIEVGWFILPSTLSGLTIGKSTNTYDVSVSTNALSVAGPISIYGGNISINAGLTATGTNTISLTGSGNVTEGGSGYVVADKLALLGGNVTLTNANNAIGTLAASGVSGLTYTDSNALTIGTVGGTIGVSATGVVSIGTSTSDLTLSQNVATTDASASALVLNAGISTAAGTATGGNIVVTSGKTVTVGNGGTAKLYTGGVAGSTNLTAMSGLGSGSGRFRYSSDEATTNFTNSGATALGTGLYAIYRESPSATGTVSSAAITYGDATPTFTLLSGGGLQNGDGTSGFTIVAAAYSTANKLKASGTPYAVSTAGLSGLGYNVSGVTNGALTVNTKTLTLTGFATTSKTYNGDATAAINNAGSLSGLESADLVTATNTGATFDNKNVGIGKTVTLNGVALASGNGNADAANYTVASTATASADIIAKTVTLSSGKTYDGTAALTDVQVTIATGIGAETLTYTGATASDAHVATAGKYINAITLGDATDSSGGLASNYALPILNATNAAVTINAATLTPTLSNTGVTKVYDGTTNVPSGFTPTWSFAGLASGDTAAALAYTGAAYNDANVANANKVTVSGMSLSGITGGNNSAVSDYVLSATSKDAAAAITKATLAVSANNDAKFVTQADTANFAGISYSGFVNGETSSALGGTATVTRTNAGTETAGAYAGVLQAGGLNSGNYQFSYANGDFTITPSNQLLVRVTDVSNSYGTVTQYAISSAEYWNGSAAVRLDNGSVSGSSVAVNASNQVTINDGAAGIATFTVAPLAATFSTANKLAVGSYQIGTSGTVTENSSNFSNSITVVGSHQVNTKALTASASGGVSKTYDGTTSMSGVTLALTGKETNDLVTVSGIGSFASKNASATANQTYTISNLALSDADASNYYLSGGTSFSGSNGQIIAKAVTLAPQAVTRDYNGVATYTPTASDINYLTALLGVSGDSVTTASVSFANKNVGTGKALTVSAATVSDGNGGNNYTITLGSNSTSAITRLSSVTWVGPTTGGNWFDPANWAGGAVPDLSNVANVIIPNGSTPVFGTTIVAPAQSGTVNLDGIGTSGSLSQNGGTLSLGSGGMTLNTFTQSGGTLNSTGPINLGTYSQTGGTTQTNGNFTTTTDFSQGTSGSVTVAGNTSITDTSGGTVIGNLNTTGTTSITSTGGDITQAAGTSIVSGGATTLDASNGATRYNIVLNGTGNNFSTVNARGNAISLTDAGALTAVLDASGTSTLNAGGNLTVSGTTGGLTTTTTNGGTTSFGTTTVTGNLSTTSAGAVSQTGALSVTGTSSFSATGQSIILTNAANDFGSAVSANASIVRLTDRNALVLGNVTTTGNLIVNAVNDITQSGGTSIQTGGSANINSSGGNATIPLVGGNTFAGGLTIVDNASRAAKQAAATNAAPGSIVPPPVVIPMPALPTSFNSPAPLTYVVVSSGGDNVVQNKLAGTDAGTGASATPGISIDIQKVPTQDASGMISVLLPKGMATSVTGFTFPLPEEIAASAGNAASITVSLADGTPLPNWLRFDAQSRSFVAVAVPDGGLPIRVMVTVGGRKTLIVVSESNE